MTSPQNYLRNLLSHQRKNIPDIGLYGKLLFDDMKRIDLFISGDPIVDVKNCCLFTGRRKNDYCYFSYRGRKTSIIRLMYHNFIEDINPLHRIKHTCENKGVCCNLNHIYMIIPEIKEIDESLGENDHIEETFKFS